MAVRLEDFTGWRQAWAAPDDRPIYQWAADHLTLPASYAISGHFDVELSRPMKAVFEDIKDDGVRRVRFRKPPRFGGSLIIDVVIPWIICNDPGPIMRNFQSDEQARGHMKEKAWPLWNSCEPLTQMLKGLGKHDVNTNEIFWGQAFMVCQGANLNSLQRRGVRWLFNEETWLPVWADLYQHAVYRTRDYERSGHFKICDVSQAGNAGDVEDRNWKEGHQAVWGYLASDGKHRPLTFGGERKDGTRWGLVWNEDARRKDGTWNKARAIETARYECEETGDTWVDSEATRSVWNRDGAYIDGSDKNMAGSRSYSVNGLLTRSFASMIDEKIDALELASRGDISALRDFKQKTECIPWEEQRQVVNLSDSATGYTYAQYDEGQQWDGEIRRSMMIDRQAGARGDIPHTWVEIRAWKQGGDSRQLYFGRVNTKESRRVLQQKYGVPNRYVWQDANFDKHEVYKECAEYGWTAFHGSDTKAWPHFTRIPGNPEPIKYMLPYSPPALVEIPGTSLKAAYLLANEDYFADILANLISGRGVKHEHPDDAHPEYLKGLQAEHKVEVKPGVFSWKKIHSSKANHGWDTSKMGIVFASVLKLLSAPAPIPAS